jgi:mycothione reductase
MKNYDFIIIGNGSGGIVASSAVSHEKKVALIDEGPPGGLCMNFGCIPTKKLTYAADRVVELKEDKKFGIEAKIKKIDFNLIMERMRKNREASREKIRKSLSGTKIMDFYQGKAHFVDEYVLEVNGEKIKGDKIVIATGTRPLIPPIEGLEKSDYLTNESLLELKKKPESIVIIGGGYTAVEFGHFLSAMGTDVTIIEMTDRIINVEEPEISDLLKEKMSRRIKILTGVKVTEISKSGKKYKVTGENKKESEKVSFTGEKILLAVGRKSNADLLKAENTGGETDENGYIKVNENMETSVKNIWALGDATGQYMFKHVANREAMLVAINSLHDHKEKMDYSAVPHAVFGYPEIASVGLTEEQAVKKYEKILVGKAKYREVARGNAMLEKNSFAKAIVNRENLKILGFHIIGSQASTLIQEVVNLKALDLSFENLWGMYIHPALPELIITTLNNLEERY